MRKCNYVVIRNSCAYNFLFLSYQVVKMGDVFGSDDSYVTLHDFLSAGFATGLL